MKKRSTAKVTLLVILKPFGRRCDDIAKGLSTAQIGFRSHQMGNWSEFFAQIIRFLHLGGQRAVYTPAYP